MKRIEQDAFYAYNQDEEAFFIGEVNYHLLKDEKPYEEIASHVEALRYVFEMLRQQSDVEIEEARILYGNDFANRLEPLTYDLTKAKPSLLDTQEFFYCPNIIKIDYYGNVFYDASWKPNDENMGKSVPYWYALMEPIYGKRNTPEDFKKVNEALFPKGKDKFVVYEWSTDWSNLFDDGHEWYGACCWSIYDASLDRYVVMLVSATD